MSLYTEGVLILVGINVMLALGYWLTANTNQFSLGHAGFMAVGAYTSAILTVKMDWSLIPAMLVGGLAAMVVGVIVGLPGLRLSILHLAMVTLAFAELVQIGFASSDYVGGTAGLPGLSGTSLPLVAVSTLVCLVFVLLFDRSRLGLASVAVREDEIASSAAGLHVTRIKVVAFAQSALITGVAGALLGHHLRFIQPGIFNVNRSVVIILFVVLGGLYTPWGPVVGAIALTLLPEVLDFVQGSFLLIYGSMFVVLMIVSPQGLLRSKRMRGQQPAWWRTLWGVERGSVQAQTKMDTETQEEAIRVE